MDEKGVPELPKSGYLRGAELKCPLFHNAIPAKRRINWKLRVSKT
jgi:hypothetical protein